MQEQKPQTGREATDEERVKYAGYVALMREGILEPKSEEDWIAFHRDFWVRREAVPNPPPSSNVCRNGVQSVGNGSAAPIPEFARTAPENDTTSWQEPLTRPEKLCERCDCEEAISDERFCKACKKQLLAEMRASGYLQPTYYGSSGRPPWAREATQETKYGPPDWPHDLE